MAGGTITFSTAEVGGVQLQGKIEWSAVLNAAANTSTVTAQLYARLYKEGTILDAPVSGVWRANLSVNGNSLVQSPNAEVLQWVLLAQQTVTVAHDSDGEKDIMISGSVSGPSGTAYAGRTTSGSETVALESNTRATVLNSLSCSGTDFTGTITCKYTPKSGDLYNRRVVSVQGGSGSRATVLTKDVGKRSAEKWTAKFTLSDEELEIVYQAIPDAGKGKLRVSMETYSDSGYAQQVGEASYKEITLNIPENPDTCPTFAMTVEPEGGLSDPLNGLYIQGRTKIKATFTDGVAKYGAQIAAYGLTVGEKSYGDPYVSDYLSAAGEVTVTGRATDTRGISAESSQVIQVLPYEAPYVKEAGCYRADADGTPNPASQYVWITASRSYSKVAADGAQKNYCTLRWRWKAEGESWEGKPWETLIDRASTETDSFAGLLEAVFPASGGYSVQIGVVDDLGGSSAVSVDIATEETVLQLDPVSKSAKSDWAWFLSLGAKEVSDVLTFAQDCMDGITIFSTGADTMNTPGSDFETAIGWVLKASDSHIVVKIISCTTGAEAKNILSGGEWGGWNT